MNTWNLLAERHGRPRIQKLTDARKAKLKARLGEYPDLWAQVEAEFKQLSVFAREGRWLNFDFVVTESKLTRLLEGQYRDQEEANVEDDDVERQFRDIEQRQAQRDL